MMTRLQQVFGLLVTLGMASAQTSSATVTAAPSPIPTDCRTLYQAAVVHEYEGLSTDTSLQCECMSSVNAWLSDPNAPTRTLTRLIGTGSTVYTTEISGTPTTITSAEIETNIYTVTSNFLDHTHDAWYSSAKPPCCYSCTVGAATVDLFFWPQASASASVTSFVSNGYTYQSPSVYIGFSSLSAYDYCGQVGSAYVNTTVAFDPEELYTVSYSTTTSEDVSITTVSGTEVYTTSTRTYLQNGGSAQLHYTDLERNCSTKAGYTYIPGNPSNSILPYDACHPTIVLPKRIQSLDPAWVSCVNNGLGGFYDPPSALNPVTPPAATGSPNPPAASTTLDNPAPGSESVPQIPISTPAPPVSNTPPPPPPPESSPASPPSPPPSPSPVPSPSPSSEAVPPPPAASSEAVPPPPAASSEAVPPPPAASSEAVPPPPAASSEAVPPPPAASSEVVPPPPAPSSPTNPGQPPPPPPGGDNNSPPPVIPTIINDASPSPQPGQGSGSGSGSGSDNSSGGSGDTVPPVNVPANNEGNNGNSVPQPNEPAVTPGGTLPLSVTVSSITIITTSAVQGGSGPETVGNGSGEQETFTQGDLSGSGLPGNGDGSSTVAPTVVISEAGSLLKRLWGVQSVALSVLCAAFLRQ